MQVQHRIFGTAGTPKAAHSLFRQDEEMWELVKDSGTQEDLKLFLKTYPESKLPSVARFKRKMLQHSKKNN